MIRRRLVKKFTIARRCLLSTSSSPYPNESLSVPINIPPPPSPDNSSSIVKPENVRTQVTALSNGLRVASHASFGQYSTVGVFVDTGSRYEVHYRGGVSQFLSKMTFQSSSRFNSHSEVIAELEQYGGLPDCQLFRDILFYNVSAFTYAVPQVVSTLADLTWRPQFRSSDMEKAQQAIAFEWEDHETKAQPESLLMELVHKAAYRDNTLGLPNICTPELAAQMELSEIERFTVSHYTPSRMVLVGVNVDHAQLVDLAEQHFVDPVTSWSNVSTTPVDTSIAQYTGGHVTMSRESAPIIGPNRLPELTHVAVAMESSSYRHDDFYAFAVLNSLMGGGGSFSAGGPGKGMYTQLYLSVLNKHHWVYHAQALNHAYSDSGLFCLFGSSHPKQTRDLVEVLCRQFYEMTQPANPVAVARAKKQLQSTLLMNLESRLVNFEDIGRQVLAYSRRLSAAELCEKIDAVTPDDVSRIAKEMYERSRPSVAVLGDLSNVPQLKEIEEALLNKGLFESKRNRFFSFR